MKDNIDITSLFARIEEAVRPFPKAAMFDLADRGYNTVFEQLMSCIISIRTLDETTIPVSLRLFERARTPEQLLKLDVETLTRLLFGTTYPDQKAYTMLGIARRVVDEFAGQIPAGYATLTSFKGVGPKCANLTLGVATGQAAISVDVHVHRVVNRWGFVYTRQPEQTLKILEDRIPRDRWIDVNRLLMPFGKYICTGPLPHCSTCPVFAECERVGVVKYQ
ncbi:endonuclease III domain-containing protein [Arsenicibacter rosenii]|uniref:DNA lyase n=1 Tax=Arsenicibacter rosenii TaxID=1750698 RepID=A0A1S2VJN2_9BACT|nr:endonuclease III [Arsenicibacter rosenii]OIN58987.1 DNA lyase [Arsenicibacter rosenii]